MAEKQKIVCLGYMPCLSPNEDWHAGQLKKDAIESLQKAIDQTKNPNADACLWAHEQNDLAQKPAPVFVYEDADQICEHLIEYSEGHPEDWFTLYYDFADNGDYTIVLMPNHNKMIHRFMAARKLFHNDFKDYKQEDITFMFSPLRIDVFKSKTIGPIVDIVASRSETMFGFLDTKFLKNMDIPDPGTNIDPRWIGPIKVGDKDELGDSSQFFKRES